jgi:hypothetical protein
MAWSTRYLCDDCGQTFEKLTDKDPRKVGGRPPGCPYCKKHKSKTQFQNRVNGNMSAADVQAIQESKRPVVPGAPMLGSSNFTKAMDETAKIVMEDYGLTNLRDNLREGDNMVMPLSGKDANGVAYEQRVDSVFKPQNNNVSGMGGNRLNSAIMDSVQGGAFRGYGDVVKEAQNSTVMKPKFSFIGEYNEKPNANTN